MSFRTYSNKSEGERVGRCPVPQFQNTTTQTGRWKAEVQNGVFRHRVHIVSVVCPHVQNTNTVSDERAEHSIREEHALRAVKSECMTMNNIHKSVVVETAEIYVNKPQVARCSGAQNVSQIRPVTRRHAKARSSIESEGNLETRAWIPDGLDRREAKPVLGRRNRLCCGVIRSELPRDALSPVLDVMDRQAMAAERKFFGNYR